MKWVYYTMRVRGRACASSIAPRDVNATSTRRMALIL